MSRTTLGPTRLVLPSTPNLLGRGRGAPALCLGTAGLLLGFLGLFLGGLALGGCLGGPTGPGGPGGSARSLTAGEERLVECDNAFTFNLFQQVVEEAEPDTSLIISPLSAAMALTMAYNGARGETQAAMAQALELEGLDLTEVNEAYGSLIALLLSLDPEVALGIANSIWIDAGYPVEPDYLELNEAYFGAEVRELDLQDPATLPAINGWVAEQTHGKIERVLDKIPPLAVLYLINAIYFKGAWTTQFDPEDTLPVPFHLSDGTTATCQMMTLPEMTFETFADEALGLRMIDLPYGRGDFRMTIVVPTGEHTLAEVTARLSHETWNAWLARCTPAALSFGMPKFKLEYGTLLNSALAALGMGVAFGPGADFSGISPRAPFISRVIHKAVIEVNEEGTEAAGVTVVEFVESVGSSFFVNRPFLFAIRDRHSGAVLFLGQVTQPVWE